MALAAWARLPSPLRCSAAPPLRPLGIQLYSVRHLCETDLAGTLRALAQIGYREVEFAGLHGHSPREVRAMLDGAGLAAPSGHVGIPDITDRIEQTIEDAKTLGHHYLIVAWLPEEVRNPEGYARYAETFNRAGRRLRQAGLALGYHNHWFEFDRLADGRRGYDILLQETDPKLVAMELDLYWIRKGGGDAADYFRRHHHRFQLVHIKDMGPDTGMVDVGAGVIDWPALLAAAAKAGVRHWFVEHDEPKDPLAFARTSFEYLNRLKW
jgi:sugar phosphate isomerase/epimerase